MATVPWVLPFLVSAVVSIELTRPFAAAPVAFDSAVAVIHFDRILAGHHLEQFISTTPKPLLTVIYGALFALAHDWRILAWTTILALAIAVAALAALARRLDGDRAWMFTTIALAGAPTLLFDTSLALATPWALLLWTAAAWAVTTSRPRYWLAGLALGLAALARLETLVVLACVLVVLGVLRFGPAGVRRPIPASAWLVALGLLAVPAAMLHDWLLIGDPLFWTTVAQRYSELTSNPVPTPVELGLTLVRHWLTEPLLIVLAVIGWLRLVERRRWPIVLGLVGLGPGVAAFLFVLAARGIYVSDRYFAAIDVAIAFAAAFGLSALGVQLPIGKRRLLRLDGRTRAVLASVLTAVVAASLTAGWGGIGTGLRETARENLRWATDARDVEPILRAAVEAIPDVRAWPIAGQPAATSPILVVPTPLRPLIAVDLNLPLTRIASVQPAFVDVAKGNPAIGQIMFIDTHAQVTSPGLEQLETDRPIRIGSSMVVPLAANPSRGYWVVRIDPVVGDPDN